MLYGPDGRAGKVEIRSYDAAPVAIRLKPILDRQIGTLSAACPSRAFGLPVAARRGLLKPRQFENAPRNMAGVTISAMPSAISACAPGGCAFLI